MKSLVSISSSLLAVTVASIAWASIAWAEEPAPAPVLEAVGKLVPGVAADRVAAAPIEGMYEVTVGPHLFYVSSDGRFMMRGEIVDLDSRKNLTRPARNRARAAAIDGLGEASMIVFSPPAPSDTNGDQVTVFTDVDCGYCAKLHREIDDYLAEGITIRYIAFPRAGVPSDSYDTMVSVWCSDDPRQAMTDAKARREVEPKTCENPVASQYEMGRLVGVRGTPTIVMSTGDIIPGYVPAKELKKAIKEARAEAEKG